jgi:hypothetical protein
VVVDYVCEGSYDLIKKITFVYPITAESTIHTHPTVCSLELSAVYFQPTSNVFFLHKSANGTFSRLFSANGCV